MLLKSICVSFRLFCYINVLSILSSILPLFLTSGVDSISTPGLTVTRSLVLFLPRVEISRFLPLGNTHWVNSVSIPGVGWK